MLCTHLNRILKSVCFPRVFLIDDTWTFQRNMRRTANIFLKFIDIVLISLISRRYELESLKVARNSFEISGKKHYDVD